MPLFDFKCVSCGHEFEELVSSNSEERDVKCPKCSSVIVKKKVSAGRIQSGESTGREWMPPTCSSGG